MTNKLEQIASLREDLIHILNCNCAENSSDTPDFILAHYLLDCLRAFDSAVIQRSAWYEGQARKRNTHV